MNVVWSDEAKTMYELIIDDLLTKWPLEIALKFEQKTTELVDLLKQNKQLCPISNYKKLRKCIIHTNVSLIYRLKGKTIEIITFVINKDNHPFF
jgi:plasmid stabilization system protein ParE